MNPGKEEELMMKRLKELSFQAYNKNISVYTDFLNLNELNLFYSINKVLADVKYDLWGGYEDAERRVICFNTDDSFPYAKFPIQCIKVSPANRKFSDSLNHRDYLGSILGLGIERSKIGDIVLKNEDGYVFCTNTISDFIIEELHKIKHTNVKCQLFEGENLEFKPVLTTINGTVSSIRLDSVLSVAFGSSRSKLSDLITGGKVFVNAKLTLSNSYVLKEGDIVSVRGLGRFIYSEVSHQTKKGRYSITVQKY
jgi:Uncharacterized conserved protein, contains S4-like domain